MLLKTYHNSQENTCARASFLKKVQASGITENYCIGKNLKTLIWKQQSGDDDDDDDNDDELFL